MSKIEVDVDGVGRTLREIKRDLHRGMEKSADTLVRHAKDEARDVISKNDAIFNSEVYAGFKDEETASASQTRVRVKLYNDVEHADTLEYGAEYSNRGPPVEALLPWVARKMVWRPGDGNADEGGGGGQETFYDVSDEDLSVGDEVYAHGSTSINRIEVAEKLSDDYWRATNGDEYHYDDTISVVRHSPVSERLDEWKRGDFVTFYDRDTGEDIDVILTGETGAFGVKYHARDPDTLDFFGEIHQARFKDYKPAPEFDRSKVTSSMREVKIRNAEDAQAESLYSKQDVVIYNALTGETFNATATSPWKDNLILEYRNGKKVITDLSSSEFNIRAVKDFENLTTAEQKENIEHHIENVISKTNVMQEDIDDHKQFVKNKLLPHYTDKQQFIRTFASWKKLIVDDDDRAHAGFFHESGAWELQMPSKPNGRAGMWKRTEGHEFGHGFTQPTGNYELKFEDDPKEYAFSGPWGKKDDSDFEHMYDGGYPNWQFDESDPMHGYAEMYMFTDEDIQSYVNHDSNGNIEYDDRDQLSPFGFDEWRDEVRAKAEANTNGVSLSEYRSQFTTTELDDRQVFSGSEFAIDEGDYITLEIDGERKPYEYIGREGELTAFPKNPDEDVPTAGEAIQLRDLSGNRESLYVSKSGDVYDTKDYKFEYVLTEQNGQFIGTASLQNYDPSLDEWPELTETDPIKRQQEAANMAWWYQASHIEFDTSTDKKRSRFIVKKRGYSATRAEEVMSTFTELLTATDPGNPELEEFEDIVQKYPFFYKAVLKQRQPLSDEVEDILKDEGLL